jgi:hypothetical protein
MEESKRSEESIISLRNSRPSSHRQSIVQITDEPYKNKTLYDEVAKNLGLTIASEKNPSNYITIVNNTLKLPYNEENIKLVGPRVLTFFFNGDPESPETKIFDLKELRVLMGSIQAVLVDVGISFSKNDLISLLNIFYKGDDSEIKGNLKTIVNDYFPSSRPMTGGVRRRKSSKKSSKKTSKRNSKKSSKTMKGGAKRKSSKKTSKKSSKTRGRK